MTSGFVPPKPKRGRPPIASDKVALIESAKKNVRFGVQIRLAAEKIHPAYFGSNARMFGDQKHEQLKYIARLIVSKRAGFTPRDRVEKRR